MRIDKLRQIMPEKGIDLMVVTKPLDIEYLCSASCSSGMLFVLQQSLVLLTDYRYTAQVRDSVAGITVKDIANDPQNPYAEIARIVSGYERPRIGADGNLELLSQLIPNAEIRSQTGIVSSLRASKDAQEIEFISRACSITDSAFEDMLNWLRPGMTEREVAIRLEHAMKLDGADQPMAYDIVVASGKRSAYPHGKATGKVIEAGDILLLDFGCRYEGYCSDLSRTLFMGRATTQQQKVYETVISAQLSCIDMLRSGIDSASIDNAAFEYCVVSGYGEQYGRGVGHGVGLTVAEAPTLLDAPGFSVSVPIPEDAVLTIEPGIYIEGQFGVRVEDVLHVTASGSVNLVHATKDLIELGYTE